MRRLVTAALLIIILAALWTGGWFATANWARGQVDGALEKVASRGLVLTCPGRDIVGFPFALKLDCGATSVTEPRSGSGATLAGVTGGASIFAPRTAQIALASPAQIASPILTAPAGLTWTEADVDVAMTLGGPQAVAFETADLGAVLPLAAMADARIAARSAQGELSPGDTGGTDAAIAFTGLELTGAGVTFPPFSGTARARLSPALEPLLAGGAALQPPLAATDMDVKLESGEARLQAEGDVAVDATGIVDGTITLRIAGANDLAAFVAALPAAQQRLGNAAIGGLLAFGKPATADGEPATELVVEIKRGRARIGPVEVTVPRLPL